MKKQLSLILATMLVTTLVPVSSFAGTATLESGYTIEIGSKEDVEIGYTFAATERAVGANDRFEFVVSNNLAIKGIKVYAGRTLVASSTTSKVDIGSVTASSLINSASNISFVITLDATSSDVVEGDFSISARMVDKTGANSTVEMFGDETKGQVAEDVVSPIEIKLLEDAKTISKDGGTAAKFEISNIPDTAVNVKFAFNDETISIVTDSSAITKNGFATGTNWKDKSTFVIPTKQNNMIVQLELKGTSKTNLGDVKATVSIGEEDFELVIAKVADYNIDITAVEKDKKDIPTILGGKDATVVVSVKANNGSLTAGRALEFVLDGASTTATDITVTGQASKGTTSDLEDGKFTVIPSGNEFKITMKLKAEADAEAGIATLTASGKDIDEDITIDVLKIEQAYKIDTNVTKMIAGDSLSTKDILVSETEVGQLKVGDKVQISLPTRLTFNEIPTVEGSNGLTFKDVTLNTAEKVLSFTVETKSKGAVGTITISDVAIDFANNGVVGRTYSPELLVNGESFGTFGYVQGVTTYGTDGGTLVFTLNSANYTVDGVAKTLETSVFTKDGRTMLPIGPLALGLGLDVNYDADTQTATFRDIATNRVVSVKQNADVLYNNGTAHKMHTSASTVNGRIFVPVASIADAFGVSVVWDDATKTVTVN